MFSPLNIYIVQLDHRIWRNKKTGPSKIRVIQEYISMSQAKLGKIIHYNRTYRELRQRVASQYTASRDLFYWRYYSEPHALSVMTPNRTPLPYPVFNNLKHSTLSLLLFFKLSELRRGKKKNKQNKNTIPSKNKEWSSKPH